MMFRYQIWQHLNLLRGEHLFGKVILCYTVASRNLMDNIDVLIVKKSSNCTLGNTLHWCFLCKKMLLQLVPKNHILPIIIPLFVISCPYYPSTISFHLGCVVKLKQSYYIAAKSSSKKCYYFWRSPWLLTSYMMKSNKTWYYALFFCTFLRDLIVFKCWFIFMVYTTNKCNLSCALVSNSGPSTMHKPRWLVILSCIPWCSIQRLCRYKITSFRYDRDRN